MAYPVFAEQNTWYKSGHKRNYFTKIKILESYDPTGEETESWNADVENSGNIKCYVVGTELIISGEKNKRLATNENATKMFGYAAADDFFKNVTEIQGIELLDTSSTKYMKQMFQACCGLEYLDLRGFQTEQVTDIAQMFRSTTTIGSMNIKEIYGIEDFNVSNCGDFSYVFACCANIKKLNLSAWKVSNCTKLNFMFSDCYLLEAVDGMGEWDVSSVTEMKGMFQYCRKLKELDFRKWKTKTSVTRTGMFTDANSVEKIHVGSNFSFGGVYPPKADGTWHTAHGDSFTAATMPSGVNLTYYATEAAAQEDLAKLKQTFVLVDGYTAVGVADAIRDVTGTYGDLKPNEWASALRSLMEVTT